MNLCLQTKHVVLTSELKGEEAEPFSGDTFHFPIQQSAVHCITFKRK